MRSYNVNKNHIDPAVSEILRYTKTDRQNSNGNRNGKIAFQGNVKFPTMFLQTDIQKNRQTDIFRHRSRQPVTLIFTSGLAK